MKTRRYLALALIAALGPALPQAATRGARAYAQGACPGSVSPRAIDASSEAGSREITVNAPEHGCSWEVTADEPWLQVQNGSGYGPGRFRISWDAFDASCGEEREGSVRVRAAGGGGGEGRAGGLGTEVVVTQKAPGCELCADATGLELFLCLLNLVDSGDLNPYELLFAWITVGCLGRSAGKAPELRRLRDEVLARSPIGREYTRLYYELLPQVMSILAANPTLYRRAVWTVARLAPVYNALNAGKPAAINPADVDEIDRLLADVAAHARLDLKRTLERARRDLRDPSLQGQFGIAASPGAPALLAHKFPAASKNASFARDLDEAYRLLLSPETVALAARGGRYVEWAQRHRGEILRVLLTDPALARRGMAAAGRLNAIHRSVVENGRASMSGEDLEAIDGFLADLGGKVGPDLGRAIARGRRDLRAPELLSRLGIDVAGEGRDAGDRAATAVTPAANNTGRAPARLGAPPEGLASVFGGTGANLPGSVVTDSSGNTYVTGSTSAANFPVTNALQARYGGGDADAFVVKIGPDGQVLYSTYLGGGDTDAGVGLALDAAGNLYVAGLTRSANFPVANALQRTKRGQDTSDAFLAKIDPTGSTLVYSTFLGGSGTDLGSSVAVDAAGNAYVAGLTASIDFPIASATQSAIRGPADAFVAKVNASGSALSYATYLGGTGAEGVTGIAVDATGAAYVTGVTTSADFPVQGPAQGAYGGLFDAFVAKLAPGGSTLSYATYLGGAGAEGASGIAVDGEGNAYVTGVTHSTDFPVVRALQPSSGGGFTDAFVTKVNASGSGLVFSTYLGGGEEDRGYRIGIDGAGRVYVTGFTLSPDFPTRDAPQAGPRGDVDGFATLYNRDGSALVYSTFLGGSGMDTGTAIAVDDAGNAGVAGISASADFPAPRQAHSPYDAFVLKLGAVPAVAPPYVGTVEVVRKPGKPERVKIVGQNFQAGIQVFVGDDSTPWSSAKRKSDGALILRQVDGRFPAGVPTRIRLVNPDGGEANTYLTP